MQTRKRYITRETLISIGINAALSVAFVFLIFHSETSVPVLGFRGVIADTAPQTFMVVLMSAVIPGLLTRRRMAARSLKWHEPSRPETRTSALPRALVVAAACACAGFLVSWLILPHLLPPAVPFFSLLIAKAAYGGALAAVVTPWAIRSALR